MCVLPARGHAHLRTSWSNVCVACSGSRTPSNQLDQCVCCLLGVTHTFEPVGPMCVLPARGHAHLRTSWTNVCVACSGSRTPSNQLDQSQCVCCLSVCSGSRTPSNQLVQCVCCLLGVTHTFEPVGPMCVLPARGHAHLRTSWTNVCVACSGSRTPSNQLDQCVCCLLGVTHTFEPVGPIPMCVLPVSLPGVTHTSTSVWPPFPQIIVVNFPRSDFTEPYVYMFVRPGLLSVGTCCRLPKHVK